MKSRLGKLIVSAVIVGLTLSVMYAMAFGATIADWPEADPSVAFKAGEDQRIWHRPGTGVMEALSGPVFRFTATIYKDEGEGFITLTHVGSGGHPVTFYYNMKVEIDPKVILSLNTTGGMWEEGFLGLVPQVQVPATEDVFGRMPPEARMLWILPPVQAYVTRGDSGFTLSLVLGGVGLNGLVILPLSGLENFEAVQNGRSVKTWGATVLSPTSIKWEGKNDDGKLGMFTWEPGWEKPVFQQDATWM